MVTEDEKCPSLYCAIFKDLSQFIWQESRTVLQMVLNFKNWDRFTLLFIKINGAQVSGLHLIVTTRRSGTIELPGLF